MQGCLPAKKPKHETSNIVTKSIKTWGKKRQKSQLGAQARQSGGVGTGRVESGLARGRKASSHVTGGLQVRLGVGSGQGGAPSGVGWSHRWGSGEFCRREQGPGGGVSIVGEGRLAAAVSGMSRVRARRRGWKVWSQAGVQGDRLTEAQVPWLPQ